MPARRYHLWRSDPGQRYSLLFGIGALLAAVAAAFAPVGSARDEIGFGRRVTIAVAATAMSACYVLAAASFRGWKSSIRALFGAAVFALMVIGFAALRQAVTVPYVDLAVAAAAVSAALILWPMGGLARLSGLFQMLRAGNPNWLTVVIPGYEMIDRIALNQFFGYWAGIALLSAGCMRAC